MNKSDGLKEIKEQINLHRKIIEKLGKQQDRLIAVITKIRLENEELKKLVNRGGLDINKDDEVIS